MNEEKIYFGDEFLKQKKSSIVYKGKKFYQIDKFPLKSEKQKLKIVFEKTDSEYIQGISLDSSGEIIINGNHFKKGVLLREDTILSKEIRIEVLDKDKKLDVWNRWIWKDSSGKEVIDSWHNGAAMMIEELPNGRRYLCNDGKPDDDFNDLIFRIEYID